MDQIHRRFSTDHVRNLLRATRRALWSARLSKKRWGSTSSRFFALLRAYRNDPEAFTIAYQRPTPRKLPAAWEEEIRRALLEEKALIQNQGPSDLKLELLGHPGPAAEERDPGFRPHHHYPSQSSRLLPGTSQKRSSTDREILTTAIGALIEHDASHHLWSPDAQEKWVLISSLDDYSRKLLYADFFKAETTWAHIRAMEALICRFGLPFRYYVDSLRVFRFVQYRTPSGRSSTSERTRLTPSGNNCSKAWGGDHLCPLTPGQRQDRTSDCWLQDRIVRTSALEKLTTIEEVRQVLQEEIHRYNHLQVHSTTGEIPDYRFSKARDPAELLVPAIRSSQTLPINQCCSA